jgi:hypothetical protein
VLIEASKSGSGSGATQADLSLLSASSMEAQRRIYAEKRRQRKQKARSSAAATGGATSFQNTVPTNTTTPVHSPSTPGIRATAETAVKNTVVEFELVDDTPQARNGRRRSSRSTCGSNASCGGSSHNDYGPSSKCRCRHRHHSPLVGSAQQLHLASGEEKLRLAADILKLNHPSR